MPAAPQPLRVVPLMVPLGTVAGHRMVVLSLEVYDQWMDLRFARIDVGADHPLPRRVPKPEAWSVMGRGGTVYTVEDAVGRGDRAFSNGEVRLRPSVGASGERLRVSTWPAGDQPVGADLEIPAAD